MTVDVVVLNQSYLPLGKVGVEKALCLIYTEKAQVVVPGPDYVRTVSKLINIPLVVVMPDVRHVRKLEPLRPTRKNVFKRDKHTCAYCQKRFAESELTIDHVIPRVRFKNIAELRNLHYGCNSWQNLVTACKGCNSWKDDRLLEELNLPALDPKAPLSDLDIDWSLILGES